MPEIERFVADFIYLGEEKRATKTDMSPFSLTKFNRNHRKIKKLDQPTQLNLKMHPIHEYLSATQNKHSSTSPLSHV